MTGEVRNRLYNRFRDISPAIRKFAGEMSVLPTLRPDRLNECQVALRISAGASAILLQARELESESRWFFWRREPFARCARPLEREIDGSFANGFRAMTNAAIDGEHLPAQELHCLFIKFNK